VVNSPYTAGKLKFVDCAEELRLIHPDGGRMAGVDSPRSDGRLLDRAIEPMWSRSLDVELPTLRKP